MPSITMSPSETMIEVCYTCKCGYTYWFPPGKLKYGQRFDCDCCGKELYIEPTRPVVKYEGVTSTNDTTVLNKVVKILNSQGFSKDEINNMTNSIEFNTDDIGELVRRALQCHE